MKRETMNLRNATDLTNEQLAKVMGGDRKPPALVGPGDGSGGSSREIGGTFWTGKRP